jgi:membrane dipeptidase
MTTHPTPTPQQPWFDAHLDLPYLALLGRDMLAPAHLATGGDLPASLTFHSMAQGNIRYALGTIFINPGLPDAPYGYSDSSDTQRAHDRAVTQLHLYQQWERDGILQIVRSKSDLTPGATAATPGATASHQGATAWAQPKPCPVGPTTSPSHPKPPLKIIILMEGADGIRTPDEAAWWYDQGLRVCSLTWARGSKYATGDATTSSDPGLSDQGRALVQAFDALGIIHDLSHLSDNSARQLLEISQKPVIASHSASRTLQGDPKRMRHISDDLAREIARRQGVIGLPLYTRFLSPPVPLVVHPPVSSPQVPLVVHPPVSSPQVPLVVHPPVSSPSSSPLSTSSTPSTSSTIHPSTPSTIHPSTSSPSRASISRTCDHIEHLASITGSRSHIALGSDLDGGFSANDLPLGIQSPADYPKLTAELASRGWSPTDLQNFQSQNWLRFFQANLQ